MKSKFFLFILFFSTKSFASICPPSESREVFDFKVSVAPIQYDYHKTAKQLSYIAASEKNNILHNNASYKALGLYEPKTMFDYTTSIKYVQYPQYNLICLRPIMEIKLTLNPSIFIAQEASQFGCTKHRVEQHELLHHKFALESISKLQKHLNRKYAHFNQYYAYHPYQLKNETERLKNNLSALLQNIKVESLKYYENEQNRLHIQIDTEENYKRESMYCSVEENTRLHQLIRRN